VKTTVLTAQIERPSFEALLLELRFAGTPLGTATGFIVSQGERHFLVTARHAFTGRHADTEQCLSTHGGLPNEVVIHHNGAHKDDRGADTVVLLREPLISPEGVPLWVEHPSLGSAADIAALPLTRLAGVAALSVSLDEPQSPISLRPTEMVSIVGYPFGLTGPGTGGLWSTGFVASEHSLSWNGKPVFLVDCRTRSGQSGAPVFAYRTGLCVHVDGRISFAGPNAANYNFLGVYTGRIREESDIGVVWKAETVRELIASALQFAGSQP
jgi:Trypsin-like peptidase domain